MGVRLRKVIVICALTFGALLSVTVAYCKGSEQGADAEKAAKVKAALVYHLSELTQWPDGVFDQDTTPITVGVFGDDPFGFADYFQSQSANFTAQGRTFIVRKLSFHIGKKGQNDLTETLKKSMRECNILFVTASEARNLSQILASVRDSSVLMVGETENFALSGGMVSFVTDKGSVKIYVNLPALKKGRIHASSEFLRHAQVVESK